MIYSRAQAVTASATALPLGPTDALYIGTSGNVTVTIGADSVTFKVIAGGVLPLKVTHVTSGSDVIALYR